MSGYANISAVPDQNMLYNAASGATAVGIQRNQLLNQETQQTLNANEIEQISRASNWVLSQDPENKDPAKQASAYGTAVKLLQANGFAKNAPQAYPGFDAMQGYARMGTPSKDLYQQTQDSAWANANKIGGGGAPGATAPPADGGAGGFSSDKETARRQVLQQETGGEANPATALNYVAKADPTALARGATASGKYQFVNSTWREGLQLAGIDPSLYPMARDAPEAVQDKVFDAVYARDGTKPWEKGPKDWVKDEQGRYQLATVRPPPGSPGGAPVTAAAAPPGGGTTPPPYRVAQAGPLTTPPPAAAPGAAAAPPGPVTTIEPETGLPMLSAPPNALAPPPPAAAPPAAAPAATAPAAAAPPPPAAPQQPPFSRPAPVNPATGLRSDQEQELNGLLPMASRSREGQAQWVARKQQMIQQNQADQRQYETQVNTWQNQQGEAADRAERIRLERESGQRAAATAQREQESAQRDAERLRLAQEANDRAGNDPTQHERILNDLAPKIKEGTATDAEQRRYAGAYYAIQQNGAQPTTMTGPGGVGTIPAMITKRVPASFPEPAGGALPLVMASPGAFKQDQMTVDQGKAGSFADRMVLSSPIMERLDDKALTWGQTVRERAGNFVGYNLNSPDYKQLRIAQEAFLSGVIRNESGAAVQQSEWDRYAHLYFPMPGDDAETIRLKRQFRQVTVESMRREAGPNYKPPDAATEAKPDSKGRPPLSSFQK